MVKPTICVWCGKPLDQHSGNRFSHPICLWCAWLRSEHGARTRFQLLHLRTILGRGPATAGWAWRLGRDLVELELTGATEFGAGKGPRPDLIVEHLIRRVYRDRWNHLQVTSYVAQLVSERLGKLPRRDHV